jgi:hypothetical protein
MMRMFQAFWSTSAEPFGLGIDKPNRRSGA